MSDYSRDLRPAKWGSGLSLHSSNPGPRMSALGQKRPFLLRGLRAAKALNVRLGCFFDVDQRRRLRCRVGDHTPRQQWRGCFPSFIT